MMLRVSNQSQQNIANLLKNLARSLGGNKRGGGFGGGGRVYPSVVVADGKDKEDPLAAVASLQDMSI